MIWIRYFFLFHLFIFFLNKSNENIWLPAIDRQVNDLSTSSSSSSPPSLVTSLFLWQLTFHLQQYANYNHKWGSFFLFFVFFLFLNIFCLFVWWETLGWLWIKQTLANIEKNCLLIKCYTRKEEEKENRFEQDFSSPSHKLNKKKKNSYKNYLYYLIH